MAVELLARTSVNPFFDRGSTAVHNCAGTGDCHKMAQDEVESLQALYKTTSLPNASGDNRRPSGHAMPPPSVGAAAASKKRKPNRPKLSPELRRPASTPHMRGPAQGDTSPLASPTSDKRRNKLGYHRTSVACGRKPFGTMASGVMKNVNNFQATAGGERFGVCSPQMITPDGV
jgi:hypothetical protein